MKPSSADDEPDRPRSLWGELVFGRGGLLPTFRALASRYGLQPADIDDVVGELGPAIAKWEEHSVGRDWGLERRRKHLFRTFRNKLVDHLRKRNSGLNRLLVCLSTDLPGRSHQDPSDALAAQEQGQWLQALLRRVLSDREYQILQLTSEGLNSPAVAERLDMTTDAVRKTLQRIREQLRELLLDEQDTVVPGTAEPHTPSTLGP